MAEAQFKRREIEEFEPLSGSRMYGPILSDRRLDPSAATKELSEELAWLGVELDGTRSEVEWARIAAEEHPQALFSAADLAPKEREERTVWEQLAADAPAQVTASIVAKAEEAATEIDIDEASTRVLIDEQLRGAAGM